MKKPKRSMGFDENPDPSQEADIDLESLGEDDEEIIDLEDIIEMPAGSIDEDEDIDLDVEILDAEPDLDLDDFEPTSDDKQLSFAGKPSTPSRAPSEPEEVDVDDLFKEQEEEGDNLFGTAVEPETPELRSAEMSDLIKEIEEQVEPAPEAVEAAKPEEPAPEEPAPEEPAPEAKSSEEPVLNEEEDELLKSLLDELDGIEEATKPAEPPPLRERAAAALKINDETARTPEIPPDIPAPEESPEPSATVEAVPEVQAAEASPAPPIESVETSRTEVPEPPGIEVPEPPVAASPKISEAAVLEQLKIPEPETASAAAAGAAAGMAAAVEKPRRAAPELPKSPIPRPEQESEPAIVVATGNDALIAELIEELVGRIEFRLLETVRQVVEAKLPGVAREIIREEIERVKKGD